MQFLLKKLFAEKDFLVYINEIKLSKLTASPQTETAVCGG